MRALDERLSRLYGERLPHLLLMVGALALAGYTVLELGLDGLFDPGSWWQSIAVWFVGAAVAHDLVLFPVYALADRILTGRATAVRSVRVLNHVRVPALAAALTFLVFLPGIVRQGSDAHLRASGLTQEPYLERWLLLCVALFLLSAVVYAVRLLLRVRQVTPPRNRNGHGTGATRVQ